MMDMDTVCHQLMTQACMQPLALAMQLTPPCMVATNSKSVNCFGKNKNEALVCGQLDLSIQDGAEFC